MEKVTVDCIQRLGGQGWPWFLKGWRVSALSTPTINLSTPAEAQSLCLPEDTLDPQAYKAPAEPIWESTRVSVSTGESWRKSVFSMDFRARSFWVPVPAPPHTSPNCGQARYVPWVPASSFLKRELHTSPQRFLCVCSSHTQELLPEDENPSVPVVFQLFNSFGHKAKVYVSEFSLFLIWCFLLIKITHFLLKLKCHRWKKKCWICLQFHLLWIITINCWVNVISISTMNVLKYTFLKILCSVSFSITLCDIYHLQVGPLSHLYHEDGSFQIPTLKVSLCSWSIFWC